MKGMDTISKSAAALNFSAEEENEVAVMASADVTFRHPLVRMAQLTGYRSHDFIAFD
jgi:hypothetical protein